MRKSWKTKSSHLTVLDLSPGESLLTIWLTKHERQALLLDQAHTWPENHLCQSHTGWNSCVSECFHPKICFLISLDSLQMYQRIKRSPSESERQNRSIGRANSILKAWFENSWWGVEIQNEETLNRGEDWTGWSGPLLWTPTVCLS